ncbi:MAG: hypothetical protein ACP5U2_11925, partial [Bryobacteraceae bacterium]
MPLRVLLGGLLCALGAAGQSSLLDLAMPDARVLFGVNVARLRSSPLAQQLWGQMRDREEARTLVLLTGFDPMENLHEVLVATPGKVGSVLMIMRGDFARTDLAAVARQRSERQENYQGVEMLVFAEKEGEPAAMAFPAADLVFWGDAASVRGAIARRGRAGLAAGELRRKAEQLSRRFDAWGYSIAPISELAARAPKEQTAGIFEGQVMKAIEQLGGGAR